ncbi:MAG: HAMP domain-containing protein, partial [Lachnospiraceae bacterium]|nr:HAMP domain-containing protein [Lachnospiraceae bacterium]
MKSIRTKLLILTLSCVMISTAVAVSISILNSSKRLRQDAFTTLELMCTEKKNALEEMLRDVEQGVTAIYEYAINFMPKEDDLWENYELRNEYIEMVEDVALIVAENTDGAVAVYFRVAPELVDGRSIGSFMAKNEEGVFRDKQLTDILAYERDDVEHVGWYYIPMDNGGPTWVEPYINKNIDIPMISYVIPVYVDGVAIGVVGIDIDMELLYSSVDEVKVYETGYAFLMNQEGEIINHTDCPHGVIKEEVEGDMARLKEKIHESQSQDAVVAYKWNGEDKYLMSEKLSNGMYFTVCVPKAEIEAPRRDMVKYSIVSMWIVLGVFLLLTIQLTRTMVKPLKELTATAERMAQSDLDVEVKCKTKDEVGTLASSIQKMADSLKAHINQINNMAYWDSLTGLKSNASYNQMADKLDKE